MYYILCIFAKCAFKMDAVQNTGTDEPVFTLDLGNLTGNPNIKFDELDGENVPDEVLVGLLDSVP